jgi:hypothetical protein
MLPMKIRPFILLMLVICFLGLSCSKTSTSTNATMSATVNGSPVTFSNLTISHPNGSTVVQGSSSQYTLTIVLGNASASIFTLAAQSSNYYATISNNLSYYYGTDAANVGQITLSQVSGSALFNGTFYFNANETSPTAGGGSITVTNGSCTNI